MNKVAITVIFAALVFLTGPARALGTNVSAAGIEAADSDVVLLIIYVLTALVVSFLCSIAESVLLSVTPAYIEDRLKKGDKRAALLKRLKQDDIDRSLAAILTLNTIAHTVGAIGAGAKAAMVFGSAWFGLFSAAMTLMILLFSEIIPKTIGALYWSKLTGFTAFFVYALIVTLYPIVWLSERLTKSIAHGKQMHIFSRDELVAMARMGERTGDIKNTETRIIRNLLHLESLRARDIMTPSPVVTALSEDMTVSDAVQRISDIPFSRLPLYRNNIDDITGFVLRDDTLVKKMQEEDDLPLKSFKRDILVVPETAPVSVLLERFLKDRQHIAMVVDEHGQTRGVVTLEDLIETLIGVEIVDEIEKIEDMRVFARKLWRDRARALGLDEEVSP